MPKVTYKDVVYDSQEELDFKHWLDEAYDAGLLQSYSKCEKGVDTFEIIKRQTYVYNTKSKFLYHPVTYTPDFIIVGCNLVKQLPVLEHTTTVDIKAEHSNHNDKKQFQIIRKMMSYFFGIYIHVIVPYKFFQETWVPEKCRYTAKQGKIKKKFKNTPTIKEYLKQHSSI